MYIKSYKKQHISVIIYIMHHSLLLHISVGKCNIYFFKLYQLAYNHNDSLQHISVSIWIMYFLL